MPPPQAPEGLHCTRKEMKNLLAVEISARGVFVKDRNVGASTRKQGSSRFEI
jgi:hypothetical protein